MKIQRYIPVLIILLYLVLVFFAPASYINKPKFLIIDIFRAPLYLTNRLFYNLNNIARSGRIAGENTVLRKTVDTLTQQLIQYKDMEAENKRLKGLLDFKQRSDLKLLAARIVGRDSSNLSDTIIIDKGKASGVNLNNVLIVEAGLIGRISEASSKLSRAMLITDPSSRVSAMVLRSRQTGMLYGLQPGLCRMKYLSLGGDIKVGDEIVTSGFSSIYPKGLMIGKVIRLEQEPAGLGLAAFVEPAADMSRTEEILCIIE